MLHDWGMRNLASSLQDVIMNNFYTLKPYTLYERKEGNMMEKDTGNQNVLLDTTITPARIKNECGGG